MRTYLFILILLFTLHMPSSAHAADAPATTATAPQTNNSFVPLQPGIPGIKEFVQSNSIPALLNNIYKIAIGVAATLAVLQIMRAGVLYMGGDSITEKKEAKDLISLSIIGLIMVLSPVIVFSIINPNIINKLDIGVPRLDPVGTQGASDPYNSGTVSTPSLTPTQCLAKYDPISTITPGTVCSKQNGFETIDASCCAQNTESKVCCGKPKISATPTQTASTAAADYMWRMTLEKQNGTGRSVQAAGPFPSQKACQDSFLSFLTNNGLVVSDATPQCTCSAPRNTFPLCKNG